MAAGNVHPSSPTLHISDTRHATTSSVKSQTAGKIAPRPLRLPLANLPLNASEDLASLPTESIVTESLVIPLPASEDLARLRTEPMVAESLVNLRTHESLMNLPLNASEDLARLLTEPIVAESLVNLRTHESLVNLPLNASEDLARLPTESIVTYI